MLKTGSLICFVYTGGNIPFVVSLCFASQRTPTVCAYCAGSISTIGLRSFLLKVSGSNSLLSFCCTSLVSGLIIQEEARFVYWQTAQRINLFLCNVKTCDRAGKIAQKFRVVREGYTWGCNMPMALCWQMLYCGPLARAIFRLVFRRGEKQAM